MKLFKIFFTLNDDFMMFGGIPEIMEASEQVGISVKFRGGGWDSGEKRNYYHNWISEDSPEIITEFFKAQYGELLTDICVRDEGIDTDNPLDEPSAPTR